MVRFYVSVLLFCNKNGDKLPKRLANDGFVVKPWDDNEGEGEVGGNDNVVVRFFENEFAGTIDIIVFDGDDDKIFSNNFLSIGDDER